MESAEEIWIEGKVFAGINSFYEKTSGCLNVADKMSC